MAKYRLVVEHIPTGRVWHGNSKIMDLMKLENLHEFVKSVVKGTSNDTLEHFALERFNEMETYFAPSLMKECTISIEKLSEL